MNILLYPCNLVTGLRLISYCVAVYFYDNIYVFGYLFTFGHALDAFDGYLARKYDQCTRFGDWFDHILDYTSWLAPFIVLNTYYDHYSPVYIGMIIFYSVFVLLSMIIKGKYLKHEDLSKTIYLKRLCANNYKNKYGYAYTLGGWVDPLLFCLMITLGLETRYQYVSYIFQIFVVQHVVLTLFDKVRSLYLKE